MRLLIVLSLLLCSCSPAPRYDRVVYQYVPIPYNNGVGSSGSGISSRDAAWIIALER